MNTKREKSDISEDVREQKGQGKIKYELNYLGQGLSGHLKSSIINRNPGSQDRKNVVVFVRLESKSWKQSFG